MNDASLNASSGRPFASRTFQHGPHLGVAKLTCQTSHLPHPERAPGEVMRFGAKGRVPCHHRQTEIEAPACLRCHGDVTARTVTSIRREFSPKAHLEQGLEFGTCHQAGQGDPLPPKSACAQCHEAS